MQGTRIVTKVDGVKDDRGAGFVYGSGTISISNETNHLHYFL